MAAIFMEPIFCVENYSEKRKEYKDEKSPKKTDRRAIKGDIGRSQRDQGRH